MDIYLIDGTYELFRYFYAVPSSKDASKQEIGAVRGVLGSILSIDDCISKYRPSTRGRFFGVAIHLDRDSSWDESPRPRRTR
jgi:hypothetical protein